MPSILINNWPQVIAKITEACRDGLEKSADKMKFEIIGEMYQGKSGRVYGSHQASAPGQSPASDTKAFEQSIQIEPEGELRTAIYPTVPYAMVLEFGGVYMAARPMWLPVGLRLGGDEGQVIQIFAREIKQRLG